MADTEPADVAWSKENESRARRAGEATTTSGKVAQAVAAKEYDPRAQEKTAAREGGPKREDFTPGPAGDIPFATAVRSWQKKQKAQSQALSSMP